MGHHQSFIAKKAKQKQPSASIQTAREEELASGTRHSAGDTSPHTVLQLQRLVGNRMVQRLLIQRRVSLDDITTRLEDVKPKKGPKAETLNMYTARIVELLGDSHLGKNSTPQPLNVWQRDELYKRVKPLAKEKYFPDAEDVEFILSFDGAETTTTEVVATIRTYLPNGNNASIKQALNDVVLGRGKATTGHDDVLHASSGSAGKAGGCTLFFKRNGSEVDIIGIGQHETSTSYNIYYGQETFGKKLSL